MLIGFPIINHPFRGTPIYGNPQWDHSMGVSKWGMGAMGLSKFIQILLVPAAPAVQTSHCPRRRETGQRLCGVSRGGDTARFVTLRCEHVVQRVE